MKGYYDKIFDITEHGLRTPREEKAFTARPKIHSHSQIFRYGQSISCLPLRPNFSYIFDLCLHWVSVVRGVDNLRKLSPLKTKHVFVMCPLRTKHVSVDIIKAPYYSLMLS